MFEHLVDKYGKILVTGPQRSGTRICSRMIATDLGYEWVPEDRVAHDYLVAREFLSKPRVVLQSPSLSYKADMFDDDVLVVFMRRNIGDILKSQERIGWSKDWKYEGSERSRYNASNVNMPIAEIKYFVWDHLQKSRVKYYMDIPYESLKSHPLWVPAENRRNFTSHQTEIDDEVS